ncbi:hypothetical protein HDU96_007502 [Phlyctochytrium bullatum]|nr:hypothetical protein HDU96_007502 [Phlyctochytrium bullatum]
MSLLRDMNIRSLVVGTAFGFVLEKAKVFVSATVSGMLVMSISEHLNIFKRSHRPLVAALCGTQLASSANILGGALVGAGMTLSGACPGTVFAQLGAGVSSSLPTLTGAILGALSYGYFHKAVQSISKCYGSCTPTPTFDGGHSKRYITFSALGVSAATAGIVLLNTFRPWQVDLEAATHVAANATRPLSLTAPAWPPVASGVAIGSVQLLSILLAAGTIGASSVYPFLGARIAALLDKHLDTNAPFFKSYITKTETLAMAAGMVAGAAASAVLSGSHAGFAGQWEVDPWRAFAGGVALVYGSRMAGGCTSGHGISGMAQLNPASFITVASMFGGGYLVSMLV